MYLFMHAYASDKNLKLASAYALKKKKKHTHTHMVHGFMIVCEHACIYAYIKTMLISFIIT